jgi:hypothetical protein
MDYVEEVDGKAGERRCRIFRRAGKDRLGGSGP